MMIIIIGYVFVTLSMWVKPFSHAVPNRSNLPCFIQTLNERHNWGTWRDFITLC